MIVRDISEMKQAEKALLASQEIFRMVSENIDQEIYLFQSDYFKVSYINPAAESIYGVPFHDLYDDPMAWARNIHPEDMEKIKADLKEKKGFDIKGSEYHEFRVNHPEKGEIWIGSNLFSIKNKPGYAVGISTDITERKILERKQKLDNQGLEDKVKKGTAELEEMNTALKILLRGIEKDKNEIGDRIFSNSRQILIPILDTLDKTMTQKKQKDLMDILRSELKNILSPFSKKLSDKMINLSPMEIQVASLIKSGKSNKEISQLLNSSIHTISRHRENIREKTDLKNSKINLRSFLLNLDESLF